MLPYSQLLVRLNKLVCSISSLGEVLEAAGPWTGPLSALSSFCRPCYVPLLNYNVTSIFTIYLVCKFHLRESTHKILIICKEPYSCFELSCENLPILHKRCNKLSILALHCQYLNSYEVLKNIACTFLQ